MMDPHSFFGTYVVVLNPEFSMVQDADGNEAWAIKPPYSSDPTATNLPATTDVTSLHYFALVVLPTVIYIGAITSILYYLKLIQPSLRVLVGC